MSARAEADWPRRRRCRWLSKGLLPQAACRELRARENSVPDASNARPKISVRSDEHGEPGRSGRHAEGNYARAGRRGLEAWEWVAMSRMVRLDSAVTHA